LKAQSAAAIRASIGFPPEVYETLEDFAKDRWPLLKGQR
jgi:hypothetical protein